MEVWEETYHITQLLPKDEKFGIISQMNRSAASIPANIAEGASRDSQRDLNRFLQIVKKLSDLIIEEQKMLMAFMKKLSNSTNNN